MTAAGLPRRLVLASDNRGKLNELGRLLAPLAIEVLPQSHFGIESAPEPHSTFVENAIAKARHACRASGLAALADDSGLCCDALNGAPGVRSARWAGEGASDHQNNAALLEALGGHACRRAHYVCVLVAMRGPEDPVPLVAEARWDGAIVAEPRGANGFGYDPHFWLESLQATAAELAPESKNRISHRGQAMDLLRRALRERWGGIDDLETATR